MEHIDIWKLDENLYTSQLIDELKMSSKKTTKLLDLNKTEFTILEKYVYDIALFHFQRLNVDINKHCIEFWCKTKFDTHNLHLDCDEFLKKQSCQYVHPLLSCVTYLNDNSCPTIITNVDLESYKYKEFEKQTSIFLSTPKRNKQITFDGSFYHGSTTLTDNSDLDDRFIIAINLWNKKPTNVDYYFPDTNNERITFNKNEPIVNICEDKNIHTINVSNKIINYNLFENILYNHDVKSCHQFNELIKSFECENTNTNTNITSFKFVLDKTIEKKELDIQLKNKYGDIMDDINEIMNDEIKLKYNRFLQRFQYTKIYTPDICHFIINECEKYATNNGGWTTKRHHKYPTTDLPVEKIPSIFGLILETLKTITQKIKSSYGLKDNMMIDIIDIFVVKYKDDAQNQLEMHHDGSFLSFNILLSDTNDFEGGGTYFDDGLTSHLEQGDILIHSSRIKHAGLPIVKGTRYLLVGFININLIA